MKLLFLTLSLLPLVCFAQPLTDWQIVDYPGHGLVTIDDGSITLGKGKTVTAVRWAGGELPVTDYEVTFEAMRTSGDDFFCALTFPVDSTFATLVLGGWHGNVSGLSCIDGVDASQNFTGSQISFRNQQWYAVRLRVTRKDVRAWLDEKPVFEVWRTDGELSLRREMDSSKPLGFASWKSAGVIRNIILKILSEQ